MKKRRYIIPILVVTLILAFALTGCQAAKNVKLAEAFLSEYYAELDYENYDYLMETLDDELIDELGGSELTEYTLILRRKLGGTVRDYEVEEVGFEHGSGMTQVTFQLNTTYDRQSNIDESFTVLVDGDDISFVGVELEALEVVDRFLADFIDAYRANDIDKLSSFFCPIYYAYGTRDDLSNMLTFCHDTAGAFIEATPSNHAIIMEDLDGMATILAEIESRIVHENMDMVMRTQLCEQDGDIGFSFIELLPAPCVDVSYKFYEAVWAGNVDDIMVLYRPEIFDNMEGGSDAWRDHLLATYQEVGAYQTHEVLQWYTDIVYMESGLEEPVIVVVNRVAFENLVLEETLGIALSEDNHILYHAFAPAE